MSWTDDEVSYDTRRTLEFPVRDDEEVAGDLDEGVAGESVEGVDVPESHDSSLTKPR